MPLLQLRTAAPSRPDPLATAQAVTPAAPPLLVRQWEYKTTGGVGEEELNKLGEEGWELVTAVTDRTRQASVGLYFKRAKQGAGKP